MSSTPGIADVRAHDYTPVQVPLVLLRTLTEAQVERIGILVAGFHATSVELRTDSWSPDNVLFALRGRLGDALINGLIEPDGSAHT